MPTIVLVVTHLAAFGLGVGTMWAATRRAPRLVDADTDHPARRPLTSGRPSWRTTVGVLALVVSLFVVGFGLQQAKFQSDQERFRGCVSDWATMTTDTLETRTGVSAKLAGYQRDRDNSLDNVVLAVIGLRAVPRTATTKDFSDALQEFAGAKARLSKAERQAAQTRQANPYPTLECRS